jgi:hypothetical protein
LGYEVSFRDLSLATGDEQLDFLFLGEEVLAWGLLLFNQLWLAGFGIHQVGIVLGHLLVCIVLFSSKARSHSTITRNF